ncbi:hypothetical protein I3842_08G094300 [Carya illinoinensis]|uniref:Uncharacterized protein n=1 Tax=Carya illinoinensis TaxID=32201 RepID=A0A922EAP9_CARIL|nr:hypothetical protein I3842_08G094300 [Carya illinoinensis]
MRPIRNWTIHYFSQVHGWVAEFDFNPNLS